MHSVTSGLANGYAMDRPSYDLGDYLPDHQPVKLNGHEYTGWYYRDGGIPREIVAKLNRAWRKYARAILPLLAEPVPAPPDFADESERLAYQAELDRDTQEREEASDNQDIAWARYLRECVCILVPGIPEPDVALVPEAKLQALLYDCGYFQQRGADQPAMNTERGSKEAESDPLTLTSLSPDSPSSMESDQTSN